MSSVPSNPRDYQRLTFWLIAALLVIRLGALFLSPFGLHGDEAQYWAWSKNLDWGYFTKPPMIAWVIAATTSVFGDAEWAVRLSSAPLHALTSYLIFLTGRKLFDAESGFWAAAIYALMPALWLSSLIVSTDVPLLLCFIIALNAWVYLREDGPSWPRAVQLGLAVGLGMMAKYAMLFFLPALGLCVLFDSKTRKGILNIKGIVAGVIAVLIVVPNVIWNIDHDFATLSHTAANANLGKDIPFHPIELLSFVGDQFGVFGPISFALYLAALIAGLSGKLGERAKWLALFGASPLVIIMLEALLSRANANWAVTSYVGGSLLLGHAVVHYWPRAKKWLKIGLVGQTVLALVLVSVMMSPRLTDTLGLANSVKRLRHWPATVSAVEAAVARGHDGHAYTLIATDKRIVFYDLKYYGMEQTLPLRMWMLHSAPQNHAELTARLESSDGPVLIVSYYDRYEAELREDFTRLEALPAIDIDLGGGKHRRLQLWAGYGYTPTQTR